MALLVNGDEPVRDFAALYIELCCGGPPPSGTDTKVALHKDWCSYRKEVEADVEELP